MIKQHSCLTRKKKKIIFKKVVSKTRKCTNVPNLFFFKAFQENIRNLGNIPTRMHNCMTAERTGIARKEKAKNYY